MVMHKIMNIFSDMQFVKTIIYRIKKIKLNINNPNKIDMIQQLYTQTNQMLKEVITSKDQETRRLQKIIIDLQNKNNSFSEKDKPYRTTIMFDATGGMGSLIKTVLTAVPQVIRYINQIKSMYPTITSSQIQIGVYRNYNSPFNEIFECTQFESQSKNLLNFMHQVSPSGGMGNEAIQVALNYISKKSMADQIIVIGYTPGNSSSEIVQKRKVIGQQYWNAHGLPILCPEKEINKLIQKNIEVNSLYINNSLKSTQAYFQKLALLTKGVAQQFHPHLKSRSQNMIKFIFERILVKIVPRENLQQIINVSKDILEFK